MISDAYQRLIGKIKELNVARSVEAVLDWDQETHMPTRGAAARAEQLSLMAGISHERRTSDEIGELLTKVESNGFDDDYASMTNVREMRRDYDRAVKLPNELVREIARVSTLAKADWVAARQDNDFGKFAPHLQRLLELKREVADRVGWNTERYDALMDEFEPGARAADVHDVFERVKADLVPLAAAIRDSARQPQDAIRRRACPREAQAAFNRELAEAMGFDFAAGRIDVSTHPFCTSFAPLDVRITTRYDENYLPTSLFGVMHETGHGLYEQGFDADHTHTPMAQAVSLGIHESQSRLWENFVGRSLPFWRHFFPKLQQHFPSMRDVSLDDWYFAINTVEPSLIRVEADEVTYGLHIMLRFELERQLIEGRLAVADVPEAWNTKMRELLGITPENDTVGCLQDIHWSMGIFGYFPTYALGNLYAAQIFAAAERGLPDLEQQIGRGDLKPLREWLRGQIHRWGMRYRAADLIRAVSGAALEPKPFIDYLRAKYVPLYGLG